MFTVDVKQQYNNNPDILSVVFIYHITDPDLGSTDLLLCRIKSQIVLIKSSIINSKLKNAYQYNAEYQYYESMIKNGVKSLYFS